MQQQPRRFRFVFLQSIAVVLLTAVPLTAADDEAYLLKDRDFEKSRLNALLADLSNPKVRTRVEAIEGVRRLGPEARVAIPKLIELLSDNEVEQRYAQVHYHVGNESARCLSEIEPAAATALSARFERLSNTDRSQIVFQMRMMGPKARSMLPHLLKGLKTAEKDERKWYLAGIAGIDPTGNTALPLLLLALRNDKDDAVRRLAAEFLTRSELLEQVYWTEHAPGSRWHRHSTKNATAIVDALLAALKDPSPEVRGPAAFSVATYPESAERVAPHLVKLLEDKGHYSLMYSNHFGGESSVARAAAVSLSRLHSQADVVLPSLIRYESQQANGDADLVADLIVHSQNPLDRLVTLLEGKNPELAFVGLARLGAAARPAIPKLKAARSPADVFFADKVNRTLACIDAEGQPKAVQEVGRTMGLYLNETCDFLGQVGPNAAFAVPFLIAVIHKGEPNDRLNSNARDVLGAIGPAAIDAAPEIIKCLGTDWEFYADDDVETLGQFGPEVISHLVESLQNPANSALHRVRCLRVLGELGPKSASAVPAIIDQIKSDYPRVREGAAQALGKVASRPAESMAALNRLITDPRPFVRAAAIESYGAFGAAVEPAIPTLVKLLTDDYLDVRVAAASTLGRLGPIAKAAVPRLNEFANSEDVLMRETVREALTAIAAK